jgi:hypothetical protein
MSYSNSSMDYNLKGKKANLVLANAMKTGDQKNNKNKHRTCRR